MTWAASSRAASSLVSAPVSEAKIEPCFALSCYSKLVESRFPTFTDGMISEGHKISALALLGA